MNPKNARIRKVGSILLLVLVICFVRRIFPDFSSRTWNLQHDLVWSFCTDWTSFSNYICEFLVLNSVPQCSWGTLLLVRISCCLHSSLFAIYNMVYTSFDDWKMGKSPSNHKQFFIHLDVCFCLCCLCYSCNNLLHLPFLLDEFGSANAECWIYKWFIRFIGNTDDALV